MKENLGYLKSFLTFSSQFEGHLDLVWRSLAFHLRSNLKEMEESPLGKNLRETPFHLQLISSITISRPAFTSYVSVRQKVSRKVPQVFKQRVLLWQNRDTISGTLMEVFHTND